MTVDSQANARNKWLQIQPAAQAVLDRAATVLGDIPVLAFSPMRRDDDGTCADCEGTHQCADCDGGGQDAEGEPCDGCSGSGGCPNCDHTP